MRTLILTLVASLMLILQPSRPYAAIDPVTAAKIGGIVIDTIVFFMKSNPDPVKISISQNREMLYALHNRLSTYHDTLLELAKKIDGISEIVKKEIKRSLDEFQEHQVRGAIDLIWEDMLEVAEGKKTFIPYQTRLSNLQQQSRTLLHRSDLSAPVMLLAMQHELSLLRVLKQNASTREATYLFRFGRIFDDTRDRSLLSQYQELTHAINLKLGELNEKFERVKKRYDNKPPSCAKLCKQSCGVYSPSCMCQYEIDKGAVALLNELDNPQKPNNVQELDLLRNLRNIHHFYFSLLAGLSKAMPEYFWEKFGDNGKLIAFPTTRQKELHLNTQAMIENLEGNVDKYHGITPPKFLKHFQPSLRKDCPWKFRGIIQPEPI